jgi:hypothetical protein
VPFDSKRGPMKTRSYCNECSHFKQWFYTFWKKNCCWIQQPFVECTTFNKGLKTYIGKICMSYDVKILSSPKWVAWFILIMVFFNIKKDDDLINLIRINKVMYTKNLHQPWDPKHEKHSSLKVTLFKNIEVIISYHELGMICD